MSTTNRLVGEHTHRRRAYHVRRLILETLEDRRVPATLNVTSPNDSGPGTLRQAILDAGAGDTIDILTQDMLTLTSGELLINKTLSILGDLTGGETTLLVQGSFRAFEVTGTSTALFLSGMQIQGGTATESSDFVQGGAILSVGADVTLDGVTILNSQAVAGPKGTARGGAIAALGGTLTIISSNITQSTAQGGAGGGEAQGGAIYVRDGKLTMTTSNVWNATALGGAGSPGTESAGDGGNALGGGLYAYGSTITINGSSFQWNAATGGAGGSASPAGLGGNGGSGLGGAIYAQTVSTLTINGGSIDTIFLSNTASGGQGGNGSFGDQGGTASGGAVYAAFATTVNVTKGRFTNNTAQGGNGGNGAIQRANQTNGFGGSGLGGAAYGFIAATYNFSGTSFKGNEAAGGAGGTGAAGQSGPRGGSGSGGAVWAASESGSGGAITVSQAAFTGNTATGGAGGKAGSGGALPGSGGFGEAGAIYNASTSKLTVNASDFSDNAAIGNAAAFGAGGAIEIFDAPATIISSRFVANRAVGGPGGGSAPAGFGQGGAIFSFSDAGVAFTTLSISKSSFTSNEAVGGSGSTGGTGEGGAIVNATATLNISGGGFTNNTARAGSGGTAYGGAILNMNGGKASTTNVAFQGNQATTRRGNASGGVIANLGASLTLTSSTITKSTASATTARGGGIYTDGTSTLKLVRSLITRNKALGVAGLTGVPTGIGGGVYLATGAQATRSSTLIVANSATTSSPNIFGTFSGPARAFRRARFGQ